MAAVRANDAILTPQIGTHSDRDRLFADVRMHYALDAPRQSQLESGFVETPNEHHPVEHPDQIAAWKARDSIAAFESLLLDRGILSSDEAAGIRQAAEEELAAALAYAEASPFPALEEALEDVFAE